LTRIAGASLAVTLGVAGQAQEAHDAELPLTSAEAIARALAHAENLTVRREEVTAAEAAASGARGAYDPLLEVGAGWRRGNEVVNSTFSGAPPGEFATTVEGLEATSAVTQLFKTGAELVLSAGVLRGTSNSQFALLTPSWDTRLALDVRQPLLRGRTLDPARFELRVAAAEQARSLAELAVEVADTVARVDASYWRLVEARRTVQVRSEAVRLAEEQLAETAIRIEQGAAPETEIAQPQAELERRRGELVAARERVVREANVLKLLIFGDEEEPSIWTAGIVPVEPLEITPPTVDVAASIERALASRAELEVERAALEARLAETEFARDQARPALDAFGTYERYGLAGSVNADGLAPPGVPLEVPPWVVGELGRSFGVLEEGELDAASVGLAFSIPIGNRAARARTAIAESALRSSEALLGRTRKLIRVEVLNAIAALESADQRVQATRAARDAAGIQLASERDRFAAGLSTNFLVLTRQNDLERAWLDEIGARADLRVAYTGFQYATGSLLEAHGIVLEGPTGAAAPGGDR
jgi:HAE1 family hydrophobic/amphiphilic exporter-1